MPPNTEPHNDRCASLLGQGCDCRSPWADDPTATAARQRRIERWMPVAILATGLVTGLTLGLLMRVVSHV